MPSYYSWPWQPKHDIQAALDPKFSSFGCHLWIARHLLKQSNLVLHLLHLKVSPYTCWKPLLPIKQIQWHLVEFLPDIPSFCCIIRMKLFNNATLWRYGKICGILSSTGLLCLTRLLRRINRAVLSFCAWPNHTISAVISCWHIHAYLWYPTILSVWSHRCFCLHSTPLAVTSVWSRGGKWSDLLLSAIMLQASPKRFWRSDNVLPADG